MSTTKNTMNHLTANKPTAGVRIPISRMPTAGRTQTSTSQAVKPSASSATLQRKPAAIPLPPLDSEFIRRVLKESEPSLANSELDLIKEACGKICEVLARHNLSKNKVYAETDNYKKYIESLQQQKLVTVDAVAENKETPRTSGDITPRGFIEFGNYIIASLNKLFVPKKPNEKMNDRVLMGEGSNLAFAQAEFSTWFFTKVAGLAGQEALLRTLPGRTELNKKQLQFLALQEASQMAQLQNEALKTEIVALQLNIDGARQANALLAGKQGGQVQTLAEENTRLRAQLVTQTVAEERVKVLEASLKTKDNSVATLTAALKELTIQIDMSNAENAKYKAALASTSTTKTHAYAVPDDWDKQSVVSRMTAKTNATVRTMQSVAFDRNSANPKAQIELGFDRAPTETHRGYLSDPFVKWTADQHIHFLSRCYPPAYFRILNATLVTANYLDFQYLSTHVFSAQAPKDTHPESKIVSLSHEELAQLETYKKALHTVNTQLSRFPEDGVPPDSLYGEMITLFRKFWYEQIDAKKILTDLKELQMSWVGKISDAKESVPNEIKQFNSDTLKLLDSLLVSFKAINVNTAKLEPTLSFPAWESIKPLKTNKDEQQQKNAVRDEWLRIKDSDAGKLAYNKLGVLLAWYNPENNQMNQLSYKWSILPPIPKENESLLEHYNELKRLYGYLKEIIKVQVTKTAQPSVTTGAENLSKSANGVSLTQTPLKAAVPAVAHSRESSKDSMTNSAGSQQSTPTKKKQAVWGLSTKTPSRENASAETVAPPTVGRSTGPTLT